MPASQQNAIRVGDAILHSEAHHWGFFGFVEGAAIGLAVGALVVSTGGLAGVALVAGATLIGGSLGGKLGEIYGRHQTGVQGQVLTGSPNVFIGFDKQPAARADADVAHCKEHSDSDSAHNQPGVQGKKIAQGSATVFINNFYAARKGDKGVCDFTLGDGWPSVFIGGPAKTADGLKIHSETGLLDDLILGAGIVGGLLLAAPVAAAMVGEGIAAGSGWAAISGQVATRLGGQFLLGMGLSKAGGAGLYYAGGLVFGQGSLGQDLSQFAGENALPLAGMIKLPGLGESGYGLIDGLPDTLGFGNEAAGADAPTLPSGEGIPPGEDAPQRYGGTGADPEISSTAAEQARANAAYDQIRSNPDDVAQIAQNTGQSPETIQTVKDHLFNSQHDIIDPNTGEVTQGNFTPDEGIANQWNKAADGSLGQPRMSKWGTPIEGSANPEEVSQFNQLIAHEYVESQMVGDGFPYQARGSWTENPEGGWDYKPNPSNYGAHDLSPNFTDNPFSHYENTIGMSPENIPRPNADNSNLDEVVAGIRRALAEDGGAGGKGPGGGMGTGAEARVPGSRAPPPEEPFVPPKPLPANPAEGRAPVPVADAAPLALPDAQAGAEAGSSSAAGEPEAAPSAPEPAHAPEAARTEPEPVPAAAATDPAAAPDFAGRLRGQDVTLPGVKTQPLTYTKRAEADAAALRRQFNSKARFSGTRNNPGPVVENRANFLKDLANDSSKEAELRAAGVDDNGLGLMRQGNVPDPDIWQVHHKLPLDDGGTNAPDNLVLIRNEPYHKVITNAQDAMTGDLTPGQTAQLPNWPVPDGSVYPPQWPIPSTWPVPPPPP